MSKKRDLTACVNYHIITLVSHVSKIMLRIIQWGLELYMERDMTDVEAVFSKGQETRDITADALEIKLRNTKKKLLYVPCTKLFTVTTMKNNGQCLGKWESQNILFSSCKIYTGQEAIMWTEYGETRLILDWQRNEKRLYSFILFV